MDIAVCMVLEVLELGGAVRGLCVLVEMNSNGSCGTETTIRPLRLEVLCCAAEAVGNMVLAEIRSCTRASARNKLL